MVAIGEAAVEAAAAAVVRKRAAWLDVLIRSVIVAIVLGALAAMVLAAMTFATDPMAGT